jgi:two-component system phosphate regulon response regulator PhoB
MSGKEPLASVMADRRVEPSVSSGPAEIGASTPMIFVVVAAGAANHRVIGIELGATDWSPRLSSVPELLLRIGDPTSAEAATVGAPAPAVAGRRYVIGSLSVDAYEHVVSLNGRVIPLTRMELRLLAYLVERRGRLCTRDEIMTDVWGARSYVGSRTVDTHVRRLREKLAGAAAMVETVRGVGYRFRELQAVGASLPPRSWLVQGEKRPVRSG